MFFDAKSGYSPEDFSHVEIMGPNGEMIGTPGTPGHAVFEETLAQHEAAGDYNTYIGWWLPDSTASSNGDGTPTTESCRRSGLPQYLVIDSRGSGESYPPETAKGVAATMAQLGLSPTLHAWPGGLSNDSLHDASAPGAAFAAELQALHRTAVVAVLGNPYPASGVVGDPIELSEKGLGAIVNGAGSVFHIGFLGSYTASVRDGTNWLDQEVAREVTACPATKIFLTGFSQGAQATADFVQRELTANEASHLGGVALFGDPYFSPGDSRVDEGSAAGASIGFHGLLGVRPDFTSAVRVVSYCELWDPFCDAVPNNAAWVAQLVAFHKIHTTSYPPDGRSAALALSLPAAPWHVPAVAAPPGLARAAHWQLARGQLPNPFVGCSLYLPTAAGITSTRVPSGLSWAPYRNPYGPDLYIISFAGAGIKVDDDVEEDILAPAAGVPRPVPPTSFIKKIAYADGSTLERWFTGDGTEFEVVRVGGERCTYLFINAFAPSAAMDRLLASVRPISGTVWSGGLARPLPRS